MNRHPGNKLVRLAEKREQNRHVFQDIDSVFLQTGSPTMESKFKVVNLNSFGALIEIPKSENENLNFRAGTVLPDVAVVNNGIVLGHYPSARVSYSTGHSGKTFVGIVFSVSSEKMEKPAGERRASLRLGLGPRFLPHATSPHPFIFDELLHFEVQNLSIRGARLITSARNNLLLRKAELSPLKIHFPTIGSADVTAEIVDIRPSSAKDRVSIGVRFMGSSKEFEISAVRYLINFADFDNSYPLSLIRSAGFKPKYVKSHVQFDYVQTADEYRQVLELRLEAYSRAKKISGVEAAASMSDAFDLHSKLVVAKYRGRIVGSVRVTLCMRPDDTFELDHSISLPSTLDRNRTAEISRLCVSTDFENTDLLHGLIERCTEVCIKAGISHVITSCVEDMLDYYRKIAFYPTGLRFDLKSLNNIPHFLLVHDCRSHRVSFRLNPLYWHFTYRRMVEHLSQFNFVDSKLPWYKRILLKSLLTLLPMLKHRRKLRK